MRKDNTDRLRITLKFVLGLGVVISLVIGLGILRFHAARLAYYLESVNQSIQNPIRIYSYCKESLGMHKVLKAETLPVRTKSGHFAASKQNAPSGLEGWRSSLAWLLGR